VGNWFLWAALVLPALQAQSPVSSPQKPNPRFPDPEFVLGDKDAKPKKGKVVLGQDGKANATFAVYGGSSAVQVSSLSFSGDGRLLAVGSTPGRVDVWDRETRNKLRSLDGGSTVGISDNGRLLAKDSKNGDGIEIYDTLSWKLQHRIPRVLKRAENTVDKLEFSPDGKLLNVTANGDADSVFDVSSGRLLVTLDNTKHAAFSQDGAFLVGGNNEHLIIWDTKTWAKFRDLPNGPEYVTQIATATAANLFVVGGPETAVLRRLDFGDEAAIVGTGFTNFAALPRGGKLVLTYSGSSGFGVWSTTGMQYCSRQDLGNGTMALSRNGSWLAAATQGGTAVMVWNMDNSLAACGVDSK
jgi:WD40 repeat protein